MSSLVCLLCLLFLSSPSVTSQSHVFTLDTQSKLSQTWSFWENSTTFDHAYLSLRSDFQSQLLMTHNDLGIKYIRFHSIFNDDIGIVNPTNPSLPYSYFNVDTIYDWVLSIGMKPLIELDFMPSSFVYPNQTTYSLNAHQVTYVGPPKNYTQWYYFVKAFVEHLTDRYGSDEVSTWIFEAWDEPNVGGHWVETNTQETFQDTWNYTSRSIKSVNSSYIIGSPSTYKGEWPGSFTQWAKDNNVPLDYFSTHVYPQDASEATRHNHNGYVNFIQNITTTVTTINPKLKIGITAYGCTYESGSNHSMGPHDTSYNAACFTTFASQFQNLDSEKFLVMSFTGFSDLWIQQGVLSNPFHNGYGWLTVRGIKKPTYQALQLLHDYASNTNYYSNVIREDSNEVNTTLEVFITNQKSSRIAIFITNWSILGVKCIDETVIINLNNFSSNANLPLNGTIYRIDNYNTNPDIVWQNMGSPMYPTQEQMNKMINASHLVPQNIDFSVNGRNMTVKVTVPRYAMAVIVFNI